MYSSERTVPFDIVGYRKLWFTLSLLVILPGMILLFTRGLNLGIDFTGGAFFRYQAEKAFPPETDPARAALTEAIRRLLGENVGVQLAEANQINVRAPARTEEERKRQGDDFEKRLNESLGDRYGKITLDRANVTFIGPTISRELGRRSMLALVVGLALLLFYIGVRYNPVFAVAGIIAMFHDVMVLVGAFALGYWRVEAPVIAAVLTVVGYSINDTVVIFDRIRENLGPRRRAGDLAHVVNVSLWQTMSRSINTGLAVIIILLCLFFMGGESISTFALALLIGITCGSYSSIFNASPIVVAWEEYKACKQRALGVRVPTRSAAASAPSSPRPRPVAPAVPDNGGATETEWEEREGLPERPGGPVPSPEFKKSSARQRQAQQRKSKRRF